MKNNIVDNKYIVNWASQELKTELTNQRRILLIKLIVTNHLFNKINSGIDPILFSPRERYYLSLLHPM